MDVHRHAPNVPVDFARGKSGSGTKEILPAFLGREIGQIEQHTTGDQFFVLAARVELSGARRVATKDALQRR